jgi:Eco57I restriction-modification methylase
MLVKPRAPSRTGSARYLAGFGEEQAAFLASVRRPDERGVAACLLRRALFLQFLSGQPGDSVDSLRNQLLTTGSAGAFESNSVPFLSGVFLEECPVAQVSIPETAWRRLFAFLDRFAWSLDPVTEQAIGPEVLDRVLEGQVDRKGTGAYYTAADVTGYIAPGTILPFLLDALLRDRPGALEPVWRLARLNPERYLFPTRCRGIDHAPSVAHQRHRDEVCRMLQTGPVPVTDLLAGNIDLLRFTLDLVTVTDDLETLQRFWSHLESLSVLDPSCGTGAFLLAALGVLEPLHGACLDRMEDLLGRPTQRQKQSIRNACLRLVKEVCRGFRRDIPARIVRNNLFGLDLDPGAVEVCRMRLFLELARDSADRTSLTGAFSSIRVGNALLGPVCPERHEGAPRAETPPVAQGGRPFDWFTEFPAVMARGGFDVVLGNPPYVERRTLPVGHLLHDYRTGGCGNLFAPMLERGLMLARPNGRVGMIVPVAAICGGDYTPLQQLLCDSGTLVVSSFNDRPSRLFGDLEHARLCIILHEKGAFPRRTISTALNRWCAVERPSLFERLTFTETTGLTRGGAVAKISTAVEASILGKLQREPVTLGERLTPDGSFPIWYTRKLSHFAQILDFIPGIWDESGRQREPSELKVLRFSEGTERDIFLAVLNSGLFYWLLTVYSDCRNLNRREVEGMRFDPDRATGVTRSRLAALARDLMTDLRRNARVRSMTYKKLGTLRIQCIYPRRSKSILDAIDRALANHYGLTAEEQDFLLHFDIRYRMGE